MGLPIEDMTPYNAHFYSVHRDQSHLTAERAIGRALRDHLHPASAIDFGCGLGNIVAEVGADWSQTTGVENPHRKWVILATPPVLARERYVWWDLREPYPVPQDKYDLAICVEVAEHLPERSAPVLIDSLTGCSDAIWFSNALPRQGGDGHINERPAEYWDELFFRRGFHSDMDITRPIVAEYADSLGPLTWYLNCRLYRRFA